MSARTDLPGDPFLLQRLLCEVALMRHHVTYGVPPTPWRICGKGHVVDLTRSEWCLRCRKTARVARQRSHLVAA